MEDELESMLSDAIQDAFNEGDGQMSPRRLIEALALYGYEIREKRHVAEEIKTIREDLAVAGDRE